MLRTAVIGALALSLMGLAPSSVEWRGIELRLDGWTAVTSSTEIYIFTRKPVARPADGNPVVWLRTEWPTLQRRGFPPFRSIVELAEVNCRTGLWRDHAQTEYPQNNAGGHGVSEDFAAEHVVFTADSPPWSDASWYGSQAQFDLTRNALRRLACAT